MLSKCQIGTMDTFINFTVFHSHITKTLIDL